MSKIKLTPHQNEAYSAITRFIEIKSKQFFLLKGYAGTGKTTIVNKICDWLEKQSLHPVLLATTGRAAKVLSDKAKRAARTIHSQIYLLGDVSDEISDENVTKDIGQLVLKFDLRDKDKSIGDKTCVYIVDEASMISNLDEKNEITKFGTGRLLDDLITYVNGEQVIFVGDPCQLPPVSKLPKSIALDFNFLSNEFNTGVEQFELKEIHRTESDNEILKYASFFRKAIISKNFVKYPKLFYPPKSKQEIRLEENENNLLELYKHCINRVGVEDSIMIAFTNKKVQSNNLAIKRLLYGNTQLQKGDLLMINRNCIPLDLVNGDHVILEDFSPAGEKAGFQFLNVRLRKLSNNEVKEGLLLDDLLWNDRAGLTPSENHRLMKYFAIKMKNEGISTKSKEFKERLMEDQYINSVKAKFGYCITCHKAQGGEWRNVFLMVQGALYGPHMRDERIYRWFYTALTRTKVHLHFNNGWWVNGWDQNRSHRGTVS